MVKNFSHKFNSIIANLSELLRSITYKRDKNTILFGSWFGEKFADNPKYLYLQALNHDELNPVWITNSNEVYYELKEKSLPVVMENSDEGIQLIKKAKYFVICCSKKDVNFHYMFGAVIINLWHGIPLKKINWADKLHKFNIFRYLTKKFVEYIPIYREYVISTSQTMQKIYMESFKTRKKYVPILGQPRNDLFFSDEFPEDENLNAYKNKKIITYMPTHRNEGKTPIDVEVLINLNKLEQLCSDYGYIFLIKKHYYHRKETTNTEKYNHIKDITSENVDSQELLKYTNILITDYSSCYIDFLLLNRPIIYFAYDYEHYLIKDREMYFDYESVAAGPIVKTGELLLDALKEAIVNPNLQNEKREKAKQIFYNKDTSKPSGEKILQFIKSLNSESV